MPVRLFLTKEFGKFTRKQRIGTELLVEAIDRAEKGQIDADLGGGVIKQRVARPNESRSRGFRTIVGYVAGGRAFFLYGFAKNDADNITAAALDEFRERGRQLQNLGDDVISLLIAEGELVEIERQ